MSCAYGTGIGAGAGLISLAFTDDPGSKVSNVARGASLGLYAGIAMGLYLVYGVPEKSSADYSEMPAILFAPKISSRGQIDGGEILVQALHF